MKLVRVKKGEVAAVYADVNFAVYKNGKMRGVFFRDAGLGDEWRVMLVMTLMALLEGNELTRIWLLGTFDEYV